jgi:HD-GYP domain-containing protein (c-di-GMP phosphodiesterase class II)
MSIILTEEKQIDEFLVIYLESLRIDSILDFDLYVKQGKNFVLYRASNMPFGEDTRGKLLENSIKRLYITTENQHNYQKYIENNIREILTDNSIRDNAKAGIVYDCAKLLVKDVLSNPTLGENIKRSQAMVETTVSYILSGRNAFHNLLQVMSFDYYTYTHSINVCTFSLALAQFAGINNLEELNKIGCGALLHDVGKTRISESILNKDGRLTKKEMDKVKKHPEWGYEITKKTDLISKESYYPILQHHERENKSGYPYGIGGNKIHMYSKIVAIADVFDAMTTKRAYRSAIATFRALKEMFDMRDTFDRKLLEQFTRLLGPKKLASP